jgi:glycyl-tRNA synthetase
MLSIDEMATFCKKKGFVYPNSELYGGLTGFFDYGHLGVELKNSIKQEWWKTHVQSRDDIVGIDGSIITHPKVWFASGHVGSFQDIMLSCVKCGNKLRADALIEEELKIRADGMGVEKINELVRENELVCPQCRTPFEEAIQFNLMFKTQVGPKQDESSIAYLRPETAQLMFVDFKLVADNARMKLPFGIAQIGRAFRNEISPRNFLFRCREFEQMEIEYFIHPKASNECPFLDEVIDYKLLVCSAAMQAADEDAKLMSVKEALGKKIIKSPWHGYWLAFEHRWFVSLGVKPEHLRIRQHKKDELSHYSTDCWDLEYKFPFGWKELQGIADRSDYDLSQHMKHSKKDLSLFDEKTNQKIVPCVVAEPSLGVDRSFLVFMFEAYEYDKERGNVVLSLNPRLAPVKVAVFPLVNKDGILEYAQRVYEGLKKEIVCTFDKAGSVGRRYARNDEIGTPYCVTIDYDSLKDDDCTIRDRDTTKQIRVGIEELQVVLPQLLTGKLEFVKAGRLID